MPKTETLPDAYGIDHKSIPSIHHGASSDGPPLNLQHMQEMIQRIKSAPKELPPTGLHGVQMETLPIAVGRNTIPRDGMEYPHLTLGMVEEYQPSVFRCHTDQGPGLLFHKRFVDTFLDQGFRLAPGDGFRPITLQAIDDTGTNTDYFVFEGSTIQESKFGSGFRIKTYEEHRAEFFPGQPLDPAREGTWSASFVNLEQSMQDFPATCMVENPKSYDMWLPLAFKRPVSVFMSRQAYVALTNQKEIQPKYRNRRTLPTYHSLEKMPIYPKINNALESKIIGYSRPIMPWEEMPQEWALGKKIDFLKRGELAKIYKMQP